MKTYILIVTIFMVVLSFCCATKKDFEYKAVVAAQSSNSIFSPLDMNKASEVISKRLKNFFDIPQENIKFDLSGNQILLTIVRIDSGKTVRIKEVIAGSHKLEFWESYENSEIIGYLSEANKILRDLQVPAAEKDQVKTTLPTGTASNFKGEEQSKHELTGNNKGVVDTRTKYTKIDPLLSILSLMVTTTGEPLPSCMIGLASGKDTSTVNRYLKMDQIKVLFPDDLKFYWSANPYKYDTSKTLYSLFAIKVTTGNKQAPLDGSSIISAKSVTGSGKSDVKISLMMDSAGTKKWAEITRENIKRCIAIVYDGHVRSYPRVMSEISGGKTEISGDFTVSETNDLVNILNSGDLPFNLKILKEQIINKE
jgi:SecD/SecF fusion protein